MELYAQVRRAVIVEKMSEREVARQYADLILVMEESLMAELPA